MTVDTVVGSWAAPVVAAAAPAADQHPSNPTSDTACSSPQDTPLSKVVQQGRAQAGAGIPANPTPPQSASSHGLNVNAWRAGSYQQHGIPVSVSYPAPGSFASPISGTLDGMPVGSEYYYTAANGGPGIPHVDPRQQHAHHPPPPPLQKQQQQQNPVPGSTAIHSVPTQHPVGLSDMHALHYHQSPPHHHPGHPHSASQPGAGFAEPVTGHFDASGPATAPAGHYMGDFAAGMYTGAPDMAPIPATAMNLPPIDTATGLPRQGYFGMAASSGAGFDPVSAAAAAAVASPGHYMAAAAAAAAAGRGHHPYPSPMMLGRMSLDMGPGSMASPPSAPAHSMAHSMAHHHHHQQQQQHHGAMGGGMPAVGAMSVPSTPARPIGMARLNSHHGATGASSTSQRKRYLCTVCQKMFARPSTLSTHMHSHTGEKPYECTWDGCGKRFSVMSNLRRHQRIHERQRSKFADMPHHPSNHHNNQQQSKQSPGNGSPSEGGSTSGSTTPLATQLFHAPPPPLPQSQSSSAASAHHMLPPPPPMSHAASFGGAHIQPSQPPPLAMMHSITSPMAMSHPSHHHHHHHQLAGHQLLAAQHPHHHPQQPLTAPPSSDIVASAAATAMAGGPASETVANE
ncbi:hypothetical protein H4R19_004565 [Coemansia spiralis]|nr:hypothetical protein H4R19_004565 [Coemansia spiralis]